MRCSLSMRPYKLQRLNMMAHSCLNVFLILAWIFGTPCSSRSIIPLRDSAGGGQPPLRNNGNPSMVVRIIVSSSSSSSESEHRVHHHFIPSSQRSIANFQAPLPEGEAQNLTSHAARRIDHSTPDSQQESHSYVYFNKQSSISLPAPPESASVTPSTPETVHSSLPVESVSPSLSSQPTFKPTPVPKVPYFKPTTYRPRPRFSFKPRPLYWLFSTTAPPTETTTTTTTIKPVPFREDIFSVFYRAFAPTTTEIQPLPQQQKEQFIFDQPEGALPQNKNVERFNILPRQRKVQDMRKIPTGPNKTTNETFKVLGPGESKIITAIISTSSSSSVSSDESKKSGLSPRINANYPRVRPSSVMLMNMRSGDSSQSAESPGKQSFRTETSDELVENTETPTAAQGREQYQISNRGFAVNSTDEDSDEFLQAAPRAEALIQDDTRGASSEKLDVKVKPDNGIPEHRPTVWQVPEQVWGEPAKVWGEPAKVWGEPAKVWGEPAKVWSVPPTNAPLPEVSSPPSVPQPNPDGADHSQDEEDAPKGSFYVLGEDEDEENPSETIPPEFSQKVLQPTKPQHPPLPDKTPEVDHSFVDAPPVASVHVAESIQVALKRQVNIRVQPTSYSSSGSSATYQNRANPKSQFLQPKFSIRSSSPRVQESRDSPESTPEGDSSSGSGQKFGYVLDGNDLRKYRVEERTPDGFIVGEYGILNQNNGFLRGVRYTADGTINPRLIHEALMKFLSL